MIDVQLLSKHFDHLEAIQELNLKVKKGSIYGLLGSNGAGKTTLLKTLAGIYREDGGQVLIDGEGIFENLPLKQRMVFIPDTLYFFPGHTRSDTCRWRPSFPWNEARNSISCPRECSARPLFGWPCPPCRT